MNLKKPNHIGIVVKDINEAKTRYSQLLGIKNWYEIINSTKLDMIYNGEKRDCEVILYVGGKGPTKIELIETKGDSNIYTEFYKKNGEGIHHIMYNVKNLEKAIAECESKGMQIIQQATFKSGGALIKYAYIGKSENEVIFELIETTIMGFIKKGDLPFELQIGSLTGSYKKVK